MKKQIIVRALPVFFVVLCAIFVFFTPILSDFLFC